MLGISALLTLIVTVALLTCRLVAPPPPQPASRTSETKKRVADSLLGRNGPPFVSLDRDKLPVRIVVAQEKLGSRIKPGTRRWCRRSATGCES